MGKHFNFKRASRERFWLNVDRSAGPNACWPWRGRLNKGGYGQVGFQVPGGRVTLAHRMAYFLETGITLIGRGVDLRHSCDNRPCCNPAHLDPGTRRQNVDEMVARGRSTKGRRGHAQPTGEDSWAAKLSTTDVEAIRQALCDGQTGLGVARTFRVSPATVSMIKNGRRWNLPA